MFRAPCREEALNNARVMPKPDSGFPFLFFLQKYHRTTTCVCESSHGSLAKETHGVSEENKSRIGNDRYRAEEEKNINFKWVSIKSRSARFCNASYFSLSLFEPTQKKKRERKKKEREKLAFVTTIASVQTWSPATTHFIYGRESLL